MFFHRLSVTTILIGLFLLFPVSLVADFEVPEKPEFLWQKKVSLTIPHNPLVIDIDGDGNLDIVCSDIRGRLLVLDAATGREIWGLRVESDASLTPPVVADFLGDGSMDIVVGTSSGRLYLVDGARGKLISRHEVGNKMILSPSVIPMAREADHPHAGVIVIDNKGNIIYFTFIRISLDEHRSSEDQGLPVRARAIWSIPLRAHVMAPASIGHLTGRQTFNIVVGTSTGDIWILNRDDPRERIHFVNFANRAIRTMPGLAQLQGDDRREIVYGDLEANLNALYYTNGEFRRIWEEDKALYESPHECMIFHDLNADGIQDIIAITDSYLFGFDGATGGDLWKENKLFIPFDINSEPAFIKGESSSFMLFGDIRGACYMMDVQKGTTPKFTLLERRFVKTPVVFNAGKNKETHVLLVSEDNSHLQVLRLNLPMEPGTISWQCQGGNQFHTGGIDPVYHEFMNKQLEYLKERVSRNLEEAKKAHESENWRLALLKTGSVLDVQPGNRQARKIHFIAYVRHNLITLILSTLLALAIITLIAIKVYRLVVTLRLIAMAQDLAEKNQLQKAAECYRKVLEKNPNNRGVTRALGHVLARLGEFGRETICIYETTFRMEPENPESIKALSQAYRHSEILEDKALDIYRKCITLVDDPSGYELLIGRIYYRKGLYEQAGKHIRRALRGGQTNIDTYICLADIYLAMNYHTRKALPIFQKVYEKKRQDKQFLEAMCEGYVDAKITDDSHVKEVCLAVIENNPDYLPAHIHMAKICIQENDSAGAARHAGRILEIDPENREGLLLQSQYYLMENRRDPEALELYRKTLKHFPEDREILKIISHIYYRSHRYDQEAEEIYHRALEHNPSDVPILLALANLAQKKENSELAISTIEKLIDLGQYTNELLLQLAEAYRLRHYTKPRAEKVYLTALKTHPDDADFITLLAEMYLGESKTDASSMRAYEKALKLDNTREDIGRQLIRTYLANKRFESASRLSRYLLQRIPDNEEIKRLMAHADLQCNKLDEAIAEYQSIIERNPNDTEALVNIALAYAQKKLTTQTAAEVYQKALRISPDNEALHRIMASFLISSGQLSRGLEEFDRAITASENARDSVIEDLMGLLSENPESLEIRWYTCDRMIESGRLREAMEQLQVIFETDPSQVQKILPYYRKILEQDVQNAIAHLRYGMFLKIIGHTEEARQAMEQAYRLMPNSPEIQAEVAELYEFLLEESEDIEIRFQLGKLYMVTRQYDQAISCFQKTAQDFRWENDSVKYLGQCFVQKGMLDLALQEFKKISIDDDLKEILYDLAQRYEAKNDLVGAKQVYKQLFAADINYRNVKTKFEMLAGSTSDPMVFEKTTILNSLSDKAKRRYELLEELGRGAMGIVYKARDNELEDIVALKILPDNLSNNPEALHRFKSEARSARKLSHKNIVRIHDIGEEMGRKYISMEFVDGIDLKKMFREEDRQLPLKQILKYMIRTAEALAYAHDIGIIHRDVKPANIMITLDDKVKVTDFGIAKIMESGEATVAGAVIGTPLYMSPEQVTGIAVDNRADIYSLGVTMYELFNGRPPFFEGDLAYQHTHVKPKLIKNIPPELQEIVFKCLEKNRDDRWDTAEELAEALILYLQSLD